MYTRCNRAKASNRKIDKVDRYRTKQLDEMLSYASNYHEKLSPGEDFLLAQLDSDTGRGQRRILLASVLVHGLLLGWLLREPKALRLTPNSIALGQNGNAVTRLYWPNKSRDASKNSSSDLAIEHYRQQRLGQEKLTWRTPANSSKPNLPQPPQDRTEKEDDSTTQTLSALGHGTQAGVPYGTLNRGELYGDEVRPALPIATSDPLVYPWQLPDTPGNEVIEITIDERGEIVRKTVLQSLGPEIDTTCLAALEHWRFQPATRNGTPIPSKQDAIFPFKARG
jgi:hypothetical protein